MPIPCWRPHYQVVVTFRQRLELQAACSGLPWAADSICSNLHSSRIPPPQQRLSPHPTHAPVYPSSTPRFTPSSSPPPKNITCILWPDGIGDRVLVPVDAVCGFASWLPARISLAARCLAFLHRACRSRGRAVEGILYAHLLHTHREHTYTYTFSHFLTPLLRCDTRFLRRGAHTEVHTPTPATAACVFLPPPRTMPHACSAASPAAVVPAGRAPFPAAGCPSAPRLEHHPSRYNGPTQPLPPPYHGLPPFYAPLHHRFLTPRCLRSPRPHLVTLPW